MRQSDLATLKVIINALPDEALRPLLLKLLQNGATIATPVPATPAKRPRGWPKGRPRGRPAKSKAAKAAKLRVWRQRDYERRKLKRAEARAARAVAAGEGMGAPINAIGTPAQQTAVKPRRSDPGLARAKRSAAAALGRSRKKQRAMVEAAKAAAKAANGSSNGADHVEIDKTMSTPASTAQAPTARALWEHAERLEPKRPWKFVADEFGINHQQTLDAYRVHRLPPGITVATVTRFLELPVS